VIALHIRSLAFVTALLGVLLALGVPVAASSADNASKAAAEWSGHQRDNDREESELDHDRGYGNDDKADKDTGNSEISDATTPDPIVDEEPAVEEPAIDEPVVDEPVVDEPVLDEPVLDDSIAVDDEPIVDDSVVEQPVVDEETVGDDTPVEEPELVSEKGIVSEEPTIETVFVEIILDTVMDWPLLVDVETVDPDTSSIIEVTLDPVDAVEPAVDNGAAIKDRDESATDHDRGFGNDDKADKNKDVMNPEVAPTNPLTPKEAPPIEEPATAADPIVDVVATTVAIPTAEPGERDNHPTPVRRSASHLAGPIGQQAETLTPIRDDQPELETVLLAEGTGPAVAAALTLESEQWLPARPEPELSFMPLDRMLLPPVGIALVDLLAASDTRFVNPAGVDSVTEAARQAAGLVALPAAALAALAMLGWAIKPAAIKAGSLFVGR